MRIRRSAATNGGLAYIALLRYSPRPSVNVDADGDPESFKNQLERCRKLAADRGGEILAVREEPDVSGKSRSRAVLDAAIEECRRTGATLLVSTLDRLSRRVAFVSALQESGVPFVAADAPNDDEFITNVKTCVSQEESRKISKRTKDAMLSMQQRGRVISSSAPFGWRKGAEFEIVRNGTKLTRWQMEPDADEQRVLARLRKLAASGITVYAVAKRLNDEGLTGRGGVKWCSVKVKRVILRDQAAGGVFNPMPAA